jgi:catechol 2,3-dioxygenase-like lactoylglutathione lyase family enzyme
MVVLPFPQSHVGRGREDQAGSRQNKGHNVDIRPLAPRSRLKRRHDAANWRPTRSREATMAVLGLDHVNVRSADPARTLSFFRDVLEMRVGPPPGAAADGPGGWIYDREDRPVVHVGGLDSPYPTDAVRPFEAAHGSGSVHHVALSCSGFAETRARLKSLELAFTESDYPQFSLRQLFVTEPNGILLELNFRTE